MTGADAIRKWTDIEKLPFTEDPEVHECVGNVHCRASVAQDEAMEGFLGWIIRWRDSRPLAMTSEGWMGYGGPADVFQTYQDAIDACVLTLRFSKLHGYRWFKEYGELMIHSVKRKATA